MKSKVHRAILGVVILNALLLLTACPSLNRNLFNTETLAVDTVTGATHLFNQYEATLLAQTNHTSQQSAEVAQNKTVVYNMVRSFGVSVKTVDLLRLAYATNSATSNLTALQAGLAALSANSSNIVFTVQYFMQQTK